MMKRVFCAQLWVAFAFLIFLPTSTSAAKQDIVVGLDADLSGPSAIAGEAIRRGALLAMGEINNRGGVLGRKMRLENFDHRGNPARGLDNIERLAKRPEVLAVLGGIHTPVALHELKAIHKNHLIYLGPWAAGTTIVNNGFNPNFVFRVSVRDEYAGGFLVGRAKALGFNKIGLFLERTGWGRSNEKAMQAAASENGVDVVRVEWFNWGVSSFGSAIELMSRKGAQAVLLVANVSEGAVLVKSMAALPEKKRLPIISHWGVTGGDFVSVAGRKAVDAVDMLVLQTFSFLNPPRKKLGEQFLQAYQKQFDPNLTARDIQAPVGVAHAYDLIQMLALAIRKAGKVDRDAVRDAMEHLGKYEGVMRTYNPPFSPTRHDALTADDFILARFGSDGAIVPIR